MQPIFVGDVQGCGDEFAALIARLEARFGNDFFLWVVGDVVNRGPRNLVALDCLRRLVDAGRAEMVLGNHELALLRVAAGLAEPGPFDTFPEVLADPAADDWVAWLRARPLFATGKLGARRFALVHAATHPAWSIKELRKRAGPVEDALRAGDDLVLLRTSKKRRKEIDVLGRLTRCRSVLADDVWSPALPEECDGRAWHEAWSEHGHDYGIVYGHWAIQGLHVAPGLRGIDTGCVHHGRGRDGFLTAWIPDLSRDDPFTLPDDGFVQEPARRRYYPPALASD